MSAPNKEMSLLDYFKKKKRHGSYRRQQQKFVSSIMSVSANKRANKSAKKIKLDLLSSNEVGNNIGVQQYSAQESIADENIEIWSSSGWMVNDDSDIEGETSCSLNEENFRKDLAEWAIVNQPPKFQLKQLLQICNKSLPFKLPSDPRTLMHTPRDVLIQILSDGSKYWHHGVRQPLENILSKQDEHPSHINLNINIDGLPLFESSKEQFWPILCNIHEMSYIERFVVGIFCGKSKIIILRIYFYVLLHMCFILIDLSKYLFIFQTNHRLCTNFSILLWMRWLLFAMKASLLTIQQLLLAFAV